METERGKQYQSLCIKQVLEWNKIIDHNVHFVYKDSDLDNIHAAVYVV